MCGAEKTLFSTRIDLKLLSRVSKVLRKQMSLVSRPEYQVVLEVGFVSLLAVASAALNIISCVIVWKNPLLRTWHNLFTINLILIDLVSTALSMTFTISVLANGQWMMNDTVCQLSGYINAVLASVIVNTLALFSFSRYQLFAYPSNYLATWNKKRCRIAIGIAWAIALLISFPPLLAWGNYRFLPKNAVCFLDFNASRPFSAIYVYVFLAVPLIFAVVYLIRLYIALRTHRRLKPETETNSEIQFRQTIRAAKSMLVLALAFFICWIPVFVVFALEASHVYLSRGVCLFSTLMIYVFGLILPLIYVATSSVFKIAWRVHFRVKKVARSSAVEPECYQGDVSKQGESGMNQELGIVSEDTTHVKRDMKPPNK